MNNFEKDVQLLGKYMLRLAKKYPEIYIYSCKLYNQKTVNVTYKKTEGEEKYTDFWLGKWEVEE